MTIRKTIYCIKCGNITEPGRRKYCQSCSDKINNTEKYCIRCGCLITRKGVGPKKYCSNNCFTTDRINNRIKEKHERNCIVCGRLFKTHSKKDHCSPECLSVKKGIFYNKTRKCLFCGNEFKPIINRHLYCKRKCSSDAKWAEIKKDKKRLATKNFSRQMLQSIRKKKNGHHWERFVNYTADELIKHLESRFKDGMSWDNYGRNGWHIDHIIPKSIFNIKTVGDKAFKKCWSLENLQPLWECENMSKGSKLFYHGKSKKTDTIKKDSGNA